jgi:hypothetical protein
MLAPVVRRYAGVVACAMVGTAVTTFAVPGPAGAGVEAAAGSSGYGLHASAEAGSVTASDPTAIAPYADQVVTKAVADLTGVDAYADGEPLYPGTAASLVPVVLFLTGAPAPPVSADIAATAHPPESEKDSVALGAVMLGPVRMDGPGATADAVIADHALAGAHNTGISGVDLGVGVPLTGTGATATTRAPRTGTASEATAEAVADLGAVKVVARSSVFPAPHADVVLVQPDGSTVPLTAAGVNVADGVVRGTAETATSSARSGATFEHPAPNGGIVRITIVSTRTEAAGALAIPDVPAVAAFGPVAPASVLADGASAAVPLSSGAFAASPTVRSAPAAPVYRPARSVAARPAAFVRQRGWLLGPLFLAWLCAGIAALVAGRRMLAPQLAAQELRVRAAQAAASDHLDRD